MAAANDPSPPASPPPAAPADATPTPEAPRIPLPPLTAPPHTQANAALFAAELARLDRVLAALVLALAFLLASVAVRNSDFWMHLASGRLLAHGEYHFGSDPFSYTSTGYWANHSWLYDLLLYGIARAAGGPEAEMAGTILVVLKALLITLLAWVMLQTRRPDRSLWIPALCTALALVVMSPRLLMQPTLISLLFLSVTLYFLQRPRHQEDLLEAPRQTPLASYWLLPPLFVLWVNLDSWFLLGPITVALYLVGQLLQKFLAPIRTGPDAPEPNQVRVLGLVLLVGVAACLLNPHHYHAFTLPAQLPVASSVDVLEREELFRQFFYWLLQEDYWQTPAAWTLASLAFWPLFLLGLASFVSSFFSGWRWWRVTIWLAFLLLSGYQVRALPFFAVVAGPIMALNWQDLRAARSGNPLPLERLGRAWALGGRLLSLVLAIALLAAAWSGWLFVSWQNGLPMSGPSGRRAAWSVEIEPSLRQTAQQLQTWRQQGLLRPDDHGYNYSPDVVNYCAWFCPEEKGFFDYRLDLYAEAIAREFIDLRQALRGTVPPAGDTAARPVDWREVFRQRHINHVVLYGNDTSPQNPGMQTALQATVWMLFDPQRWTLLYMDGRTSIFRWNDPRHPAAAAPTIPPLNLATRAFGPQPERAPAESPEQAPAPRDLAARWLYRAPSIPLDADLAGRYLGYFNQIRQEWPMPALVATQVANLSATVGLAAVNPGSVAVPGTVALHTVPGFLAFTNPRALEYFLRDKSYGPAAAPVLALRAARRAIAASPEYAESYFALAEAYAMLWGEQEEHWVGGSPAGQELPRDKLRQVQLVTALEDYLILRPFDGETHWKLFQNYARLQYFDLALEHFQVASDLFAARGPGRGESREAFQRRMDQMQQQLAKLRTEVKSREDDYQVDARDKPLSGKVQKAVQNRLMKRARDLLAEADPTQLGPSEIGFLVDLLLSTGHPEQARDVLSEGWRASLGANYDWYKVLIGAASGNYQQAGQFLEEYVVQLKQSTVEGALRLLQMEAFQGGLSPATLYGTSTLPNRLRQVADWRALRGLLALEEGDNAEAARSFRQALELGEREGFSFESRPLAQRYLQLLQEAGGARN